MQIVSVLIVASHLFFIMQKWYIDANIQCFHGTHIIIGTIAIVFLVMSVAFIPFVGFACSGVILKVNTCIIVIHMH